MLFLKKVEVLAEFSTVAHNAGIRSTQQLALFLECAAYEGNCLSDIFGLHAGTLEYRAKYVMARQLMLGAANRGYNGARLLKWGDTLYGKEREVLLTAKGRKLFGLLEEALEKL